MQKNLFFEKISKSDRILERPTKKRKTQITNIGNETEATTPDSAATKE